jgi:hypothetical protein
MAAVHHNKEPYKFLENDLDLALNRSFAGGISSNNPDPGVTAPDMLAE